MCQAETPNECANASHWDEGLRLYVFRAWDKEWSAECNACGEVHWGGGWMNAMVAAWGHLAMSHARPPLRLVIPEQPGQIGEWDTSKWFLTNGAVQ